MAASTAHAPLVGIPLNPLSDAPSAPPSGAQDTLELIGRAVVDIIAPTPPDAAAVTDDDALRSLRLLALDNLASIVDLHEQLHQRDERMQVLEQEVQTWQSRAVTEMRARTVERGAAYDRERELVSVLHATMLERDGLHAELQWRRRPWWRRGRRPEPAATP